MMAYSSAFAQVPPAAQPVAPTPPVAAAQAGASQPETAHALDSTDVNDWLDGYMPLALTEGDIAGAVVVVVKDGQVLTARGFGVSDVATQAPVVPDKTLFRAGSVSKLFTWTAVMQQVEAGKIDLDADVNRYLDFTIPARDGKPVTMRNLMTHAAGFEEHAKHLLVADASDMTPLRDYLVSWVPDRIFPPGEVPAYSNYGASLAGYIVQRVSGEELASYIEHHILTPLGMTHASFRQPLPAALLPDMSHGYLTASEPAKPFEFVEPWPAGSLSVTGTDMARFMMAHLNDGTLDTATILKPETAELMHRTALAATPPLPGMALGFYHEDRKRPCHHRACRRHRSFPHRPASVPRRQDGIVHFAEQPGRRRRGPYGAHAAVRQLHGPLLPRGEKGQADPAVGEGGCSPDRRDLRVEPPQRHQLSAPHLYDGGDEGERRC